MAEGLRGAIWPWISRFEWQTIDMNQYPNVKRWLDRMKALKSWSKVHEVFHGFAASLKDQAFEAV